MPSACRGLLEERGYIGASTSPIRTFSDPSGPVAITVPWCTDSRKSPRRTSATTLCIAASTSPFVSTVDSYHFAPDDVECEIDPADNA
ncbi:hypothetical protein GCM10010243_17370 [Streptomyces matensis]|nr:hypothetical protein GCM10010243_17370 [Streptomyces matensis]